MVPGQAHNTIGRIFVQFGRLFWRMLGGYAGKTRGEAEGNSTFCSQKGQQGSRLFMVTWCGERDVV